MGEAETASGEPGEKGLHRLGVGVFAFIFGVISLFGAQIGTSRLWGLFGVTWGRDNLPTTPEQELGALSTLFVAVFVGSLVAAMICKRDTWRVLMVMCLVGVLVDGYAMFVTLQDALPLSFRLTFVGIIPVATILAGWLATRYLQPSSHKAN